MNASGPHNDRPLNRNRRESENQPSPQAVGARIHGKDDSRRSGVNARGNGTSLGTSAGSWIIAGLAALTLALLLSACAAADEDEPPRSDKVITAAQATPASMPGETQAGGQMDAATAMTDVGDAPAAGIAEIRFGHHPGFERLVIDFATGQETANAAPHWLIEKADGHGVVRIHLPTVTETEFTEALLPDSFARFTHVYVVRAPDGSLFLDIFIPGAYQVRVLELRDPQRLVVDVAPNGPETYVLPATAEQTVLITPRPGATVHGSLTISGYSRHFEANNVFILQDGEGNEVARAVATSTDYIETWGYFSTVLEIPPLTGVGTLLVGEFSAQDGEFQGVSIPVQFGGS